MDKTDLIERLERATEPDRGLDDVIARAAGDEMPARDPLNWPPHYTESTEAALTLLPAWASFELTKSASGPPAFTRARLWDWRRSPTMSDPGNEWKSEGNRPLEINICIAALKMLGL